MIQTQMDPQLLLALFKEKGALLEGHFILSSGRHSDKYFQSALLLQDPATAQMLGESLAEKFTDEVNVVLSPALGGLIIGHEVARAKKCRAIFSEKDKEGKPVLRRGFSLDPSDKVLVIEDVVTTGLSTREVIDIVKGSGANLVGLGAILNRSGKKLKDLFPGVSHTEALLELAVQSWAADEVPLDVKKIPPVKPGSRRN
jgi:orotate phosphoribosyltransferase